jgi:hypothetical protein
MRRNAAERGDNRRVRCASQAPGDLHGLKAPAAVQGEAGEFEYAIRSHGDAG